VEGEGEGRGEVGEGEGRRRNKEKGTRRGQRLLGVGLEEVEVVHGEGDCSAEVRGGRGR
jgi:hypothetical protein